MQLFLCRAQCVQGWPQRVLMPPNLVEGRRCRLQAPYNLTGNPQIIHTRAPRGKCSCAGDSLGWHFMGMRLSVWLVLGRDLALTQSEVQRASQGWEHQPVLVTLSSDPVSTCGLAVGRAHSGTPERALWSQASACASSGEPSTPQPCILPSLLEP